jgi:hypothetical protein
MYLVNLEHNIENWILLRSSFINKNRLLWIIFGIIISILIIAAIVCPIKIIFVEKKDASSTTTKTIKTMKILTEGKISLKKSRAINDTVLIRDPFNHYFF